MMIDDRPLNMLTASNPQALTLSVRASCFVFEDPLSKAIVSQARQIAPSDATALIIGETGTGKELIARHVHSLSHRRNGPFVGVSCAAFSETLAESELFGHERGAFTGALNDKAGWFETAHGGTLFLDEIGDLPLPIQVKLLRVIQEREVVRVGSRRSVPIDVRLLAATHVNLEEAVAAGRFREDLYYRLNVAMLHIPALRERPGDILPLAHRFLEIYGRRLGHNSVTLAPEAAHQLLIYPWPGNIRELENVIHHALLVCCGSLVRPENLRLPAPREKTKRLIAGPDAPNHLVHALEELFGQNRSDLYQHIDATVIRSAFEYCEGNQVRTARLLGISRNIVRDRLSRYGLLKTPDISGER